MRMLLAVPMFLMLCAGAVPAQPADLVLRGGAVYTCDASRSWAQALGIRDGKLVFVGTDPEVERWIGPSTRVLELGGRMVLPGFHDAHVHPVSSAVELAGCNLVDSGSAEEVARRIRESAAARPAGAWLVGTGWELTLFPEGQPNRAQLDALVGGRPAFLTSSDGHTAWVSSRALELAGVTRETPDPTDGRIDRDASREPTGLLRESAITLVQRHVPPPTPEEILAGVERGLALANQFGITTVHEANATLALLEGYRTCDREGRLTARVIASLWVDPEQGPEQVPELVRQREQFRGARLEPRAAKLFADGVVEAHTAALLEPYVDRRGDRGILNYEPEELRALVESLDRAGFQIHIHAIGDRAVQVSLDCLESARTAHGARDARHHLAHLQLIAPEDIPRFRRLGVIANIQALWAYADPFITELTEPFLGAERSRRLYPFGSLYRSGAVIVGGSDWSVTSMNPLPAIEVAITREDPEKTEGRPWLPDERLDLADMLAAYTINGAYVGFLEKETGSLEVGKAADLVVLDRNLFDIPPSDIGQARVLLTLLEGRIVYQDSSWPTLP